MQKKDLSKLVLTTLLTGSVLWGGTAFAAEENLQEFSLDNHGCYRNQNGNDR